MRCRCLSESRWEKRTEVLDVVQKRKTPENHRLWMGLVYFFLVPCVFRLFLTQRQLKGSPCLPFAVGFVFCKASLFFSRKVRGVWCRKWSSFWLEGDMRSQVLGNTLRPVPNKDASHMHQLDWICYDNTGTIILQKHFGICNETPAV